MLVKQKMLQIPSLGDFKHISDVYQIRAKTIWDTGAISFTTAYSLSCISLCFVQSIDEPWVRINTNASVLPMFSMKFI